MKAKLLLASVMLFAFGTMVAQPTSFSGPRKLIQATTHGLIAPVWSPDGQRLAVTGDNYTGIWVANASGSELKQVSQSTGAGYQMFWSDNTNITSTPYTMVDNRRMTRVEQINVINNEVRLMATAERNFRRSRVAPQASALAIMLDDPMNATVRLPELSPYQSKMVINPTLSPDGQKIAFQIVGKGLFVCNADGTDVKSLGKGAHAAWMPDSKHVMAARIEDNGDMFTRSDIYCVDINDGSSMCITPDSDVIPVTMAVSPDGSQLVFDNDSDGCIYVIDLKY